MSFIKYKPLTLIILGAFAYACLFLVVPKSYAQTIPAGCPGGPTGPPSAGTVCPDGGIPVRDITLPLGCPGSDQQGPLGPSYQVQCPARPGRAECTFSQATGQCIAADGQNVAKVYTPARNNFENACSGTIATRSNCACTGSTITTDNCGIIAYLVKFMNVLSALVGIVIVLMITFRGLQYSFARDNPQAASAAKTGIRDAVFALIYFLFIFAFLQWLVPGGIF
jgi:hypothetical protein